MQVIDLSLLEGGVQAHPLPFLTLSYG